MSTVTGLLRAVDICEHSEANVERLKAEGQKLLAYTCLFAPVEIMTAAGVVPYRLRGDTKKPVTLADDYLERFGCPYVRSLFERALRHEFDFADGLVLSHSCDMVLRIYGWWISHAKPPFSYFVNIPHTTTPWSLDFYKRELQLFVKKMEEFSGTTISSQSLRQSIELHNQNRALVRDIYEMKKKNPPLISGSEMLQVLVAGMGIPAEEFGELLREVKDEVAGRESSRNKGGVRLLFYGSICDDAALIEVIEECGGSVVIDDTCIGTRSYWRDVPVTDDPLDGLVHTYLEDTPCPRTYLGPTGDRFDYIVDLARDFGARGVVMNLLDFCDPHKFDAPDLQDHLTAAGLPSLPLYHDYLSGSLENVRLKLQAFMEILMQD